MAQDATVTAPATTTAATSTPAATATGATTSAPVPSASASTAPATAPAHGQPTDKPAAQEPTKDAASAQPDASAAAKTESDEIAKALADLNRETRAAKAEREKARAEMAKVADRVAVADRMDKVAAAVKGRDFITALKSIDPDLSVDEAILTLLEQAKAADAQPLSQADIERITAAKIEQDRKTQAEAAEKAQKETLERANTNYVNSCASAYHAEREKGGFSLIAQFGVADDAIKTYARDEYAKGNGVPSPLDTMKHFEADYERKLKAAGYTKAEIAAMKTDPAAAPARATQTAPVPDTQGTTTDPAKPAKRETIAEYDKRKKAELRALRANGAAAR